jgi:hypothetical protein
MNSRSNANTAAVPRTAPCATAAHTAPSLRTAPLQLECQWVPTGKRFPAVEARWVLVPKT